MHINCPECGFSRQVNENRIPPSYSFATCPKCGTRFRFRTEREAPASEPDSSADGLEAARQENLALHDRERPDHENATAENDDAGQDIWARMEKMNDKWEKDVSDFTPEPDKNEDPGREREAEPDRRNASDANENERREEANRAYQRASAQNGRAPLYSPGGSVPWECKGGFMQPKGFISTILLTVKETRRFFAGMNPFSSILPAWAYAMLCYVPTLLMMAFYYKYVAQMIGNGAEEAAVSGANYIVLFLNGLFLFTFFLFMGSLFVHFTLRILAPQKASFRLSFKVMAYAHTGMLLMLVPIVGGLIGLFAFVTLLVQGVRHSFKLDLKQSVIVVLPFLVFIFFIFMQSFRLAASVMQGMPM